MKEREFHYLWKFDLKASPEMLWPLLADTSRFNKDSGLPSVQSISSKRSRNAHRRLGFSRLGVNVEWDEQPFEWLKPERFGVVRIYRKGPVQSLRVLVSMHHAEGGGTELSYEIWA